MGYNKNPRIKFNCFHCGIEATDKPNRYMKMKHHFCSQDCYFKHKGVRKEQDKATIKQRFEALVMPEPNTGCWLWVGTYDRGGYGTFHPMRSTLSTRAHRSSYLFYKGKRKP